MKNQNKSRLGFTLIELLVVVLIIGVLSSIALPKYQKAVHKSRAAGVFSQLSPARQAYMAYKLANPNSNPSITDLDVEMPEAKFPNQSNCHWIVRSVGSMTPVIDNSVVLSCAGIELGLKNEGIRYCCSVDNFCNDIGFGTYADNIGAGKNCYTEGGYTAY